MSFLLPNGKAWTPAKWISMGFFSDAVGHLKDAPHLADEIRFCLDSEVDTIDLRDTNVSILRELQKLVQSVLAENVASQGGKFLQVEYFPLYLRYLHSLDELVSSTVREAE
jgi:hypothetical protein